MESIVDLPRTAEDLLTIAQFNDTVRLTGLLTGFMRLERITVKATDTKTLINSSFPPERSRPLLLQRAAVNRETVSEVSPIVHEVLRSPGQSLDSATRAFFESRFGHDFSQVRVHIDAKAAESAQMMNALAYTVGSDVVFGVGQYAPGTLEGHKLLAHELAHVVQQGQGNSGVNVDAEERAQAVADRVAIGQAVTLGMVGGAAQSLQLANKDGAEEKPAQPYSLPGLRLTLDRLDKFEHNNAKLTEELRRRILLLAMRLLDLFRSLPGGTLKLIGHTDTSGDEKHNQKLGLNRANAVKRDLLFGLSKLGISLTSLSMESESRGETEPAVLTGENMRNEYNRRVEVVFQAAPLPFKLPTFPPSEPLPAHTPSVPRTGPKIPSGAPPKDPLDSMSEGVLKLLPKPVKGLISKDDIKQAFKKGSVEGVIKLLDELIKDEGPFNKSALLNTVSAAIRQFIFGEKWTPPTPPLHELPPSKMPEMPKVPGEVIIPIPWPTFKF